MNAFGRLALPPALVTETVAAPAVPVGVSATMSSPETTVTLVDEAPPIVTVDGETKPLPEIWIAVPPAVEPEFGVTAVTVGAAR